MKQAGKTVDLPISLPQLKSGGRYWVAYSGGLDSTVLLHWLGRHAAHPVVAVHVNHGLHPDADNWAEHCRRFCAELDIPLEVVPVQVTEIADYGLEAAARHARYRALTEKPGTDDLLLTAHHRNDQAETLLLQLLRGSGPQGLAAMREETRAGGSRLYRPLLMLDREALLGYAQCHGLRWIEDPSNDDRQLRRNFLRHEVLPLLEAHWPACRESLARSAELQGEAAVLLDELALSDMKGCLGSMPGSLSVRILRALAPARRRNLLRFWLRDQGLAVPGHAHMQRLENDMLTEREDAGPVVNWHEVEVRRYRDDLLAMSTLPPAPVATELDWNLQGALQLPAGCGTLVAECAEGAGLRLQTASVTVRFSQTGERIQPLFSSHHRRLKHLLQEAAVPPWVRERLPLIYHGGCLAAVADRWIAADSAAQQQEKGWIIHWRDAPVGWPVADSREVRR